MRETAMHASTGTGTKRRRSRLPSWAAPALAALCAPAGAAPQVYETAKLVVPATEVGPWDWLGRAVSVTEDTAWVGAPGDEVTSTGGEGSHGSVSGYVRTPGGWERVHFLTAAKPMSSATLGEGVSFSATRGFVGAPYDNEKAFRSGALHLFEPSPSGWKEVVKIKAPDVDRLDQLGYRVTLSGDQLLVSAHGDDEAGPDKGAAYVYRRTASGEWVLEQKLIGTWAQGWWGGASYSLDLSGNVAVMGATGGGGLVFVFERVGGNWVQTAVLKNPAPHWMDGFGRAVAVEGDVIAVGEPLEDNDTYKSGSVFIFERAGAPPGNWALAQVVQASNKSAFDQFGIAVDLFEGRLLVGARWGELQGEVRGLAYLFERNEFGWEETMMLAPRDESAAFIHTPSFGESVALSASFALVGGPTAMGTTGWPTGAAYVFELPLGEPTCAGVANSTGAAGTIDARGSLSAAAGALDLSAADLPAHQTGMFLIADSGGFVQAPGGSQGDLCLGGTIGRFEASLQSSGDQGMLRYTLDFDALPLPPPARILPGETWHFQAWYRDHNPMPTSNFTGALAITFR